MEKQDTKIITTFLRDNFPDLFAIYLFGSHANGSQTEYSDVDLALLTKKRIEKVKLVDLQSELATILDKEVDLIDLRGVSEVMNAHIIMNGEKLYQIPDYLYQIDQYEQITLQAYVYLQENLEALLAEIKKTGKIYH